MINPNTVINITRSLAHEIGHTLGIGHYRGGLMESGGTSSTIVTEYIHWASGMYIVRCGRHMVKFIQHTSPNR